MRGAVAKTVILANGEPPSHPIPLGLFRTAERLVCCDGALAKARQLGREPDLVVGDGDSLKPEDRLALGTRFVQIAEQETNDLAKAFRESAARYGVDGMVILGAEGLREDHFLGNVFRLLDFSQIAPDCQLVTNAGVFSVVIGERTYSCKIGDPVSVFAPIAGTKVTSQGLVWPLEGVSLDNLWSGTLNRTRAETFALTCDRPVLVYRPHPSASR